MDDLVAWLVEAEPSEPSDLVVHLADVAVAQVDVVLQGLLQLDEVLFTQNEGLLLVHGLERGSGEPLFQRGLETFALGQNEPRVGCDPDHVSLQGGAWAPKLLQDVGVEVGLVVVIVSPPGAQPAQVLEDFFQVRVLDVEGSGLDDPDGVVADRVGHAGDEAQGDEGDLEDVDGEEAPLRPEAGEVDGNLLPELFCDALVTVGFGKRDDHAGELVCEADAGGWGDHIWQVGVEPGEHDN